ncbi:MAG: ABC transporter ATP-binding protein [Nitrospiraceae bacterium]|nr:ABC transporter ATP-binding protein [Nitrospiraceae bacterium]
MIEFSDVWLKVGNHDTLRGVNLRVWPGGTRVILGLSGSGKSTILKLMLGLLKPDCGTIRIGDRIVTSMTEQEWEPIRRDMSMVFQGSALFDSLTVNGNVGYRLREEGVLDESEIEQRIWRSLCFVGLEDTLDMMPADLSGGMKKRVAIARALAWGPKIILYDEPTGELDPANSLMVSELILRLHKQGGVSQVVVTHDLDIARRVAVRFAIINEGRIVFDGKEDALRCSTDPSVVALLKPEVDIAGLHNEGKRHENRDEDQAGSGGQV